MLQVYYGDGKGKTTAAMGLAMRAAGHGLRVRIIQFMKGNTYSGELASASKLDIGIFQFGRTCPHAALIKSGFMQCQECGQCWISGEGITDLDRQTISMAWQFVQDSSKTGSFDLLILDEILNALDQELIGKGELLAWLEQIPDKLELVLTGRNLPGELLAVADLISEVKNVKHPYELDIKARRGIEY